MASIKGNLILVDDKPAYAVKKMGNPSYYFHLDNIKQLDLVNAIADKYNLKKDKIQIVIKDMMGTVPGFHEFMIITEQLPNTKWYDQAILIHNDVKYIRLMKYCSLEDVDFESEESNTINHSVNEFCEIVN